MVFHFFEEGDEGRRIGGLRSYVQPDDILRIDSMLKIIARFELTVSHSVFFHPHEGGIMVGLGITVALTAYMELLGVFFELG